MRIAYITAHTPFGRGETFVLDEMLIMAELSAALVIVPRNPPREVFHSEARSLLDRAIWLPLVDRKMLLRFLQALILQRRVWTVLRIIARESRSPKIFCKNLAVVPKALFVIDLLRREDVDHIHAHWGSTTSTMAWIISELGEIPWSLTVHRWDITENNMLKLKVERSVFTRCISEGGRRELIDIVGGQYQHKAVVLHTGVGPTDATPKSSRRASAMFTIACPANLIPIKGHRFLIEACSLLRKRGKKEFRCLIIGDGPLLYKIQKQVARCGLQEIVLITRRLPHDALMGLYKRGDVDAVVLPSTVTARGEAEGIPVALMEAMSYGIPVVATNTGNISELLSDGAGIMVADKDAPQLADILERLLDDDNCASVLAEKGQRRVNKEFNLVKNARKLLTIMKDSSTL